MNIDQFCKNGKFLMLALDHRGSFMKLVNPDNPESVTKDVLIQIKSEIISAVKDQCTGLLIDVDYGLPAYSYADKPFLLPVEKSGYTEQSGERITEIEYSAGEIKNLGGAGVKLLLYFNPSLASAEQQLSTAEKVLAECKTIGLPFFLELVVYQPNGPVGTERAQLVIDSVRMFVDRQIIPDVFKLEYPGDAQSCQIITELVGSTPWILLTRGDSFETFLQELEHAVAAGARGFLAGRALWQEGCSMHEEDRRQFFETTLSERFQQIISICTR